MCIFAHKPLSLLNLHASKVMLKILQPRVQQYMELKLPNIKVGFRKGWVPIDIASIPWIIERQGGFKNIPISSLYIIEQ